MALPPQAIEKLIREPSRTQGVYRELLFISSALLALSIIVYAGLAFGYRAYLNSSLSQVEARIATFSAGISEEDRAQVQDFYSQLVNLRTLLAGHTVASPVMALLEQTVQPDVYYTKLTMNATNNQAVLTGAARSLSAIAAQAAAFQGRPEVERIDFNNAGAQTSGPWQFTMTIYLRPEVFRGVVISVPVPTEMAPTEASDIEGSDEPTETSAAPASATAPAPTSTPQ